MGKFTLIVAVAYILYYSAMITYDLFIKKEPVKEDNTETEIAFDLSEESQEHTTNVGIDDVENMNIPTSYDVSEEYASDFNDSEDDAEEKPLTQLEAKYKLEHRIKIMEDTTSPAISEVTNKEHMPSPSIAVVDAEENEENNNDEKSNKREILFEQLLNEAKSEVRVVATVDDIKLYALK